MGLINESKHFDDFSPEEKSQIFNVFKQSYEKATGTAWSIDKFYSRASEWLFFGDPQGFVTVRPQRSGYYKLTGVAGSMKSIMKGLNELVSTNMPIWGMLTDDLASILIKRYGFRKPNKIEGAIIAKLIPSNVFGNVEYKRNPDGSVTFNYKDVGEATKVFVGNKPYFIKSRKDAFNTGIQTFKSKFGLEEEVVDESRAVQSYYEESFRFIKKYLEQHGFENTFVSFRKSIHTTFINRNNEYDTPTGMYVYPMKNFKDAYENKGIKNMREFMGLFPYTPNSTEVLIFQLGDVSRVLFSSTCTAEIAQFWVDKIRQVYGSNQIIAELCDSFNPQLNKAQANEDDQSQEVSPETTVQQQKKIYPYDTYMSRISGSVNFQNDFQKLWLFIYDIAYELRNQTGEYKTGYFEKYATTYTTICLRINLQGFIDDTCSKIIHPNEPCQGVLFQNFRNNLVDFRHVPIHGRYDREPDFDQLKGNALPNPEQSKGRFESYLRKLWKKDVHIMDDEYQIAIKERKPFLISVDETKYYIDQNGNRNVTGLNAEEILDNKSEYDKPNYERTAYINSAYGKDFDTVYSFGKYGENVARAYSNQQGNVFINKKGEPDISGVNLDAIEDNSSLAAAYFNQKLGSKEFRDVYIRKDFVFGKKFNDEMVFINLNGEPDLSLTNFDTLPSDSQRAAYMNQMLGEKKFSGVVKFGLIDPTGNITFAAYSNNEFGFINRKGEPDISGIELDKINPYGNVARAAYFNQKLGIRKFAEVKEFGHIVPNIAVAITTNGATEFINTEGIPDISAINPNNISNTQLKAAYYNTKWGTQYTTIEDFKPIGKNNEMIAVALTDGLKYNSVFVDAEGKDATDLVDVNKISDSHTRAAYVNKVLGTDYGYVTPFDQFAQGIAYALDKNTDNGVFINTKGEPDVSTIDPKAIPDEGIRIAFFKQKYGLNLTKVDRFGAYSDDVTFVRDNTGNKYFMNTEGKPDTNGVDSNEIHSGEIRAIYFRQKFGKIFKSVGDFGRYGDPNIALAEDKDGELTLINREGEFDMGNADLTQIGDRRLRAKFMNTKYGTDFQSIQDFDFANGNIGLATTKDGKKVFINKQCQLDTDGVKLSEIYEDNDKALYINQRYNKHYDQVMSIGTYGENLALATQGGNYYFINLRGLKTIKGVDVERVLRSSNSVRAAYYNQKTKNKDRFVNVTKTNNPDLLIGYVKDSKTQLIRPEIINLEGLPVDTTNIDPFSLIDSSNYDAMAEFYNKKYGTEFKQVVPADIKPVKNRKLFFGDIGGYQYVLLDDKGKVGLKNKEEREALNSKYGSDTIDKVLDVTKKFTEEQKKKKLEKQKELKKNNKAKDIVKEEIMNFLG